MTLGAALVGAGLQGRIHLDALRRLSVDVRGIWASNAERAEQASRDLRVRAYRSYDELLADASVDVVHIVTPTALHADLASAALAAGRHVVCEKPLATSSADASLLLALAKQRDSVHAVGFTKRHYPWVVKARSLIQQGRLGQIRAVRGGYLQAWARTGGADGWRRTARLSGSLQVTADLGSHWTDLASYMTGLPIQGVVGQLATLEGSDPERAVTTPVSTRQVGDDYAQVLAEMSGGALASFVVSQMSIGNEDRLWIEIDGDDGSVAWTNERPAELRISRHDGPIELHVSRGQPDAVREFLAAVYGRVANPGRPAGYATFADGLDAVLVGEAILRSSQVHGWVPVVSMPVGESRR